MDFEALEAQKEQEQKHFCKDGIHSQEGLLGQPSPMQRCSPTNSAVSAKREKGS